MRRYARSSQRSAKRDNFKHGGGHGQGSRQPGWHAGFAKQVYLNALGRLLYVGGLGCQAVKDSLAQKGREGDRIISQIATEPNSDTIG